jgi:hypothetical protein
MAARRPIQSSLMVSILLSQVRQLTTPARLAHEVVAQTAEMLMVVMAVMRMVEADYLAVMVVSAVPVVLAVLADQVVIMEAIPTAVVIMEAISIPIPFF